MTRQQLLDALSLLDTGTLQRLHDLSSMIILPEEDLLITATMEQMVAKAHTLANTHFPQWTDRSKADFGEFLVELFALFSEKDFWYINALSNEGYLEKASTYSNVYMKALMLGYKPTLFSGSLGVVQLTVSAGSAQVIPTGGLVVSIANTGLVYSNYEAFTVPASAVSSPVFAKFAYGTYTTYSTKFNGKSVRVSTPKIDKRFIELQIDGITWYQVDTFSRSNGIDKHFLVVPNEDGSVELVFGRGGYGSRPTLSAPVIVKYLHGGDANGTFPSGQAMQLDKAPSTGRAFTVPVIVNAFVGGSTAESMEAIRNRASLSFRRQGRVINPTDCETYLTDKPEIAKAKSINWANNLYFYIILADGTVASQSYLDALADEIEPLSVMGYSVSGVPTVYIPVTSDVEVFVLSGFNPADTATRVRDYITSVTDPLQDAEYGADFVLSAVVQGVIQNVPGVTNMIFNSVNGSSPANVVVGLTQILRKMTTPDLTITTTPV